MKPGWKTTEFWLKLGAMVSALVLGSGLLPTGSTALSIVTVISTILAALGYNYFRASGKGAFMINESQKVVALQATRDLSLKTQITDLPPSE